MSYLHKVTLPSGTTYDVEGTLLSITGTQTGATNLWTGSTTLEELKAGVTIAYYLPYAGTTTAATLNLTLADGTTTGAKNIYFEDTTPVKQQFKAGSLIILYYDGIAWHTVNYTDTKNTAGSTDTSSKIFLVGTTSQTSSAQTYSHDTVFIDTSDYLNSKTPTSTSDNTTKVATTAFVQSVIGELPTPMQFKGTVGASGTITWANLPSAASGNNGWTYKVIEDHSTAPICEVGDTIISNGSEWVVIPSGDEPDDTWRAIQVNGTEELGNAVSTGDINFADGTNSTVNFTAASGTDAATIQVNVTTTDTYSSTGTEPTTGKAVAAALGTLDGTISGTTGSGKTLTAFSQTDGKVSATFGDISITKSQVSDFSHSHGNITNGGDITATAPTIANGDQLIINDDSASKITNGPTFDGSTTTKALTPKGTWENFLQSHQTIKQDGITGATVNRFGTCSTGATTAAKTVKITTGTWSLEAGAQVLVKFTNANTANSPTLRVDWGSNTGTAKNIQYKGSQITTGDERNLLAGTCLFVYDGTQYHLVGGGDTFDGVVETVLKTSDANKTTLADITTNIVSAQGTFSAGDYPVTFSVANETLTISNGTKPSLGSATTKKISNYVTVATASTTSAEVYAPPSQS